MADRSEAAAEKFQEEGRQLVTAFFMLLRSVKLYSADNAVFVKPLEALKDLFNQVLANQGQLTLQIVGASIYLNGTPIKFDLKSMDSVRHFIADLGERKVGGLVLKGALDVAELKKFVWTLGQPVAAAGTGLGGKVFGPIELLAWNEMREKLQDETEGRRISPKQTWVVYSRALFFMRKYFESRAAKQPNPASGANRLVEALVDLGKGQRKRLLTLATLKGRDAAEYHVFHAVNVALFAIALGFDLELDRAQLRDLGMSGLFHDVGSFDMPESAPGALPDRRLLAQSHLLSTRVAIAEGMSTAAAFRLLATFEQGADFGTPVRGPTGKVVSVTRTSDLTLYSRVLSICSTFDTLTTAKPPRQAYAREAALELMWSRLRQKFDPALLVAFTDILLPGKSPWITAEEREAIKVETRLPPTQPADAAGAPKL
jgi:hypothetical protein